MIYRNELKFDVSEWHHAHLVHWALVCPLLLSEIYQPRTINNIYFDTIDKKFCQENLFGLSNRVKLRLRWYESEEGESENNVFIEAKIKSGENNTKIREKLEGIDIKQFRLARDIQHFILPKLTDPQLSRWLSLTEPVVKNRYKRMYFGSDLFDLRLTLDNKLAFGPANQMTEMRHSTLKVLELKFGNTAEKQIFDQAAHFPFRKVRFSKFMHGLRKCGTVLY
jgi:hypothetical protein